MKKHKNYIVPFSGLSIGKHTFEMVSDEELLAQLKDADVLGGELKFHLDLEKQSTMLILQFHISGFVKLLCDRCLDEYDQVIDIAPKLIVKFGHGSEGEDDDIITIPDTAYEFDTMQYIYEYIVLSLPYKRMHPEDEEGNSQCDPEVIAKLNAIKVAEKKNEEIDPRWKALANLKQR